MKKEILLVFVCIIIQSCNSQKKDLTLLQSQTKNKLEKETFNLTDFKFKTNVNEVLSGIGLTLNDNILNEYNISGDYEEFKFAPQQISLFGNDIDQKKMKFHSSILKKTNLFGVTK
jgi:hypothetical protein